MPASQDDRARWVDDALQEHEGPLLRYATRLLGDVERARDVVQDTFLRLCRADRAKIEGYLPRWLFKVCRNRALEVARKEGRMTALSQEQLAERPSPTPDPAAAAERKDNVADALRALATLPDRQQEVVRLKFQNDLSYRDIAEVTGLSVSNVGFLLHTALTTIRRELKTQEA